MAGILRKILPVTSSVPKENGDGDDSYCSFEYSFAIEYSGPVTFNIPRAMPLDVNQIPIAAPIASASLSNDVPLPVVQPIIKSTQSKTRPPKDPKLGSDNTVRLGINGVLNGGDMLLEVSNKAINLGALDCATDDECRYKLTGNIGSSGRLSFADCGEDKDKLSDEIQSSGRLTIVDGGEGKHKLSDEMQSSDRLETYDGCVSSHELSGHLKMLNLPADSSKEDGGGDLQDYMIPRNCKSISSESSSHSLSSEIFSCKDEEHVGEAPGHVKRPSIVTFIEPESYSTVQEDFNQSESESSTNVSHRAIRPGKKGTCYRCQKGNRFSEKEVCIVCRAKYCRSCVLRAMGSMPEGRKCVTCIGQKIDESKRNNLGKSSRLLKKILSDLLVKQIMSYEKLSEVNQLPSNLVYVNGQSLCQQEIFILQSCQHPPKKLKPGEYWYDKVSGFWGKEGHKPCQIISPQLSVGGHMKRNASNGNANIFINGREITNIELMMLQLLGVKCEGTTSFWVNADGSYQEEGMNNIKGKIWDKHGAKYICAVLSLPTPPDSSSPNGEAVNAIITKKVDQKTLHKLLLVGSKQSGTSTIFKQAKLAYNVPFTEEERQSIKSLIQSNFYGYLGILLEARELFEEESLIRKSTRSKDHCSPSAQTNHKTLYSLGPKLKSFSDWFLKVMVSGNLESIFPAAAREYAPFVEELWKDPAIQATYDRRNELESLPRVATYFLERAVEIARADYQPSDLDILYAEGISSSKGLSSMEFSFPTLSENNNEHVQQDPSLRYQLIRVHPTGLGGNLKWLEMFDDIDIVLFCVSLTDYDEVFEDENGVLTNKMIASRQLFESIATHPTFEEKKFLLILNKFDLLEEKIERVPLTKCEWFQEFNPVMGHHPNTCSTSIRNTNTSLAHRAFQYIAVKFKMSFNNLTDKKLFVSPATGLELENVDEIFRYAREIMRWDKEEWCIPNNNDETSSASIEASSTA